MCKNLLKFSVWIMIIMMPSCKLLMKWELRKNSPYDITDKQITAVSKSLTNLLEIKSVDIGMRIHKTFLADQLSLAIDTLNKLNWKNEFVDSIRIEKAQDLLVLENELMNISPSVRIYIHNTDKRLAFLRNLTAKFTTRVSPAAQNDTLYVFLHFDELSIISINGKKLWNKYCKKKRIIREFVLAALVDTLNTRFTRKPISFPLNLNFYKDKRIDQLFTSSPNQKVISRDSIKLKISLRNFATHIDTSGLYIVADLGNQANKSASPQVKRMPSGADGTYYIVSNLSEYDVLQARSRKNLSDGSTDLAFNTRLPRRKYMSPLFYSGTKIELNSITKKSALSQSPGLDEILIGLTQRHIDSVNAKKARLQRILSLYSTDFDSLWTSTFDHPENKGFWVEIKRPFISNCFNTSLNNIAFRIEASNSVNTPFEKKNINIGQFDIVDKCAEIRDRECHRLNCNINWNCCGCKWYRPWCCACEAGEAVARGACNVLAATEYGLCKAKNYAEFLWCETKIFGEKILNELAKVGDVNGKVEANGKIILNYGSFKLSPELDAFALNTDIEGAGSAKVDVDYYPKGLVGYLLCPFSGGHVGITQTYNVLAPSQKFGFNGQISASNTPGSVNMNIKTGEENLFLVISPPPLLSLLSDPKFVLKCPVAAIGLTLGDFYCAFFKDGDIQQKALAGITGLYNYKFKEFNFNFQFSSISVNPSKYSSGITLSPKWDNKGIVFQTN